VAAQFVPTFLSPKNLNQNRASAIEVLFSLCPRCKNSTTGTNPSQRKIINEEFDPTGNYSRNSWNFVLGSGNKK
jgi:hypothetical protein